MPPAVNNANLTGTPTGILPTPTGAPSPTSSLTGFTANPEPNIPAGWQTQPTTLASMSEAVYEVQITLGPSQAAAFMTWYTAAYAKDPTITPDAAVGTWMVGTDVATGVAAGTGFTAAVGPAVGTAGADAAQKAISAAEADLEAAAKKALTQITPGAAEIPALGTAEGNAATSGIKAVSNLLGAGEAIEHLFDEIKGFFDLLTDKDMWISLGWLAIGSILLMIGIIMFVIKKAGPSIAAAAPLAMAA